MSLKPYHEFGIVDVDCGNSALFTFFITYILFELPSNILLKKLRPSVFLSSIIGVWGVITIAMGCTKSFGGLVACRLLIGFFEVGVPDAVDRSKELTSKFEC